MNIYRLTVNVNATAEGVDIEEVLFDNLISLPVRQAADLNEKEIFGKLKKVYSNLSSIILEEFP